MPIGRDYTPLIDREIEIALRRCYRARKKFNQDKIKTLDDTGKYFTDCEYKKIEGQKTQGCSIIGISGGGKTTSICSSLYNYPQTIRHTDENSRCLQVVYIRVECPADGSLKSFYNFCLDALGNAVGKELEINKDKMTIGEKERLFKKLALRWNLGMIVIEEIQQLSRQREETMNHFLTLANDTQIPIIYVGTVFGVNNVNLSSYVWRKEVDGKLKHSLNENKHIVLYGSSKQGKSSSIRENIPKDDYIQINCDINSSATDVYKSLLRKIGISFKIVSEETSSSEMKTSLGVRLKTIIAILGSGEVEANGEISTGNDKSNTFESIQYNLEIANDVCEVLEGVNFSRYIVLENFHYLDDEVQNKLAFDLRTFHDRGFYFIIVGIWKDKNRLVQYNGELADRIIEIPVEPWIRKDFIEVARKGSSALNILIGQDIIGEMIELSFGSIGIFQELLKLYCIYSGVTKSLLIFRSLTDQEPMDKAIHEKADQYETRFLRALEDIATAGSRKEGLFIPYYFIKIIVNSSISELTEGIHRETLTERLCALHHSKEVQKGVITYHLHQLTALQCKKNISPPIFDYDRINKYIRVIDPTLLFFLNYRTGEEIMEEIIDPRMLIVE